jgi:uncharacterized LabA/DUF88 family protein
MSDHTDQMFVPFYSDEKLAIFIDGSNLYAAARSLNYDIDYKLLLKWGASQGRLLRAFYYTALYDDQEYSPIRPLVDWLDYNGFTIVTKPTKEYVDSSGRRKVKGNMDIELAVDAMEMADQVDHIVLFSGDGDFRSLVESLQRSGVRVTVISTTETDPSMVADELRRQADNFIELSALDEFLRPSTQSDEGGDFHQGETGGYDIDSFEEYDPDPHEDQNLDENQDEDEFV